MSSATFRCARNREIFALRYRRRRWPTRTRDSQVQWQVFIWRACIVRRATRRWWSQSPPASENLAGGHLGCSYLGCVCRSLQNSATGRTRFQSPAEIITKSYRFGARVIQRHTSAECQGYSYCMRNQLRHISCCRQLIIKLHQPMVRILSQSLNYDIIMTVDV